MPVSFSMLLNLVSASNSEDKDVLWGFIRNYDASMTPQNHPELDRLADYAVRYFHDLVRPHKAFRAPDARERAALEALDAALGPACPPMPTGRRSRTRCTGSATRPGSIRCATGSRPCTRCSWARIRVQGSVRSWRSTVSRKAAS